MDTEKRSEVEIYIFLAISLDGFIARNSGEIDWLEKFNFDEFLKLNEDKFQIIYKSKSLNYLPGNKDFRNKIKIRLVLLGKKRKRA